MRLDWLRSLNYRRIIERGLLISAGILVALAIIECSIWLAGHLAYSKGDARLDTDDKSYVILALGESTTADLTLGQSSWPYELEGMLNNNTLGMSFRVVNKGMIGRDTTAILAQVDGFIEEYDPDMIISMIGINDQPDTQGPVGLGKIAMKTKTWRFLSWTARKIENLSQLWKMGWERRKISPEYETRYSHYYGILDYSTAEKLALSAVFLERITDSPHPDPVAYLHLGNIYLSLGRAKEAEDAINRSAMLQESCLTHCMMARLKMNQKDFLGAASFLNTTLCRKDSRDYQETSLEYYFQTHRWDEAKSIVENSLSGPEQSLILSLINLQSGEEDMSINISRGALTQYPEHMESRILLAYMLRDTNEAESLVKSFPSGSDFDDAINYLSNLYIIYGMDSYEMRRFLVSRNVVVGPTFTFMEYTPRNYRALRDKLSAKHIKLIAMQYPTLEIDNLIDMLGEEDVSYVSNEIFNALLQDEPYDKYFIDSFGMTFGHATLEGNKIIARNAARTVWDVLDESGRIPQDITAIQG
jgi:lysophospholipase L1-like esterase